jgi:hypothetical protein
VIEKKPKAQVFQKKKREKKTQSPSFKKKNRSVLTTKIEK